MGRENESAGLDWEHTIEYCDNVSCSGFVVDWTNDDWVRSLRPLAHRDFPGTTHMNVCEVCEDYLLDNDYIRN